MWKRIFCGCLFGSPPPSNNPALNPLKSPSKSTTKSIPFVPPITEGEVIHAYDGDTITIVSKLPYDTSPLYRFSVRLAGIDCPEIKGKTDRERELAQEAKAALQKLILNKVVALKNLKTEKYGRVLADVYLGDLHVNQWLLDNKYAVPYSGGTKTDWN
jgi:endonuclease YncB( thermonuclease family)